MEYLSNMGLINFLKIITVFLNSADPRLKEQRETLVVVEYDGAVFWMPQAILRSNCPFSTTYFPFDTQTCKLKFGSWSYDGTQVDLEFFQDVHMMSLTDYLSSTEWDIVDNYANKTEFFYDCCPHQPFPDLTFYIKIKRKVAFYTFILILPCALLSLLTLVIFWVPPESPAKLVLGKTTWTFNACACTCIFTEYRSYDCMRNILLKIRYICRNSIQT